MDEKGNVVDRVEKKLEKSSDIDFSDGAIPSNDPRSAPIPTAKESRKFTPIAQYKPTGSLIYGDALEKLEKRVTFK